MNKYTFNDCYIGMKESFTETITSESMEKFFELTGDFNPLHKDDIFAQEISNGKFKQRVCYGMLTAAFISTLAGVYLPGKYCIIHGVDLNFVKPVFVGDCIIIEGEIIKKHDTIRQLTVKVTIKNQHKEKVLRGNLKVGVML